MIIAIFLFAATMVTIITLTLTNYVSAVEKQISALENITNLQWEAYLANNGLQDARYEHLETLINLDDARKHLYDITLQDAAHTSNKPSTTDTSSTSPEDEHNPTPEQQPPEPSPV